LILAAEYLVDDRLGGTEPHEERREEEHRGDDRPCRLRRAGDDPQRLHEWSETQRPAGIGREGLAKPGGPERGDHRQADPDEGNRLPRADGEDQFAEDRHQERADQEHGRRDGDDTRHPVTLVEVPGDGVAQAAR